MAVCREACKASVKMFNVPDQTIPRPKSQVHQPGPGPKRWRSESEGDKGGDRKKNMVFVSVEMGSVVGTNSL